MEKPARATCEYGHRDGRKVQAGQRFREMVPRGGIEPPTLRFSEAFLDREINGLDAAILQNCPCTSRRCKTPKRANQRGLKASVFDGLSGLSRAASLGVVFRYESLMGQPISETKKADLLKRAEARLNFALNLPAPDVNREAKIKAAEKAIKTALASKTDNVRKAKRPAR
jgi:hypothetical protein